MRIRIIALLLLYVLGLSSCDGNAREFTECTFTASFEAVSGLPGWSWKAEDCIVVTDGTDQWQFVTDDGGGTATFKGQTYNDPDGLLALWPSVTRDFVEGVAGMTLPSHQSGLKSGVEHSNVLAAACAAPSAGSFSFIPLNSFLKFSVDGDHGIVSVEVRAIAGERLSGNASVGYSQNPELEADADALPTVRISCGLFDGTYYISVLPQTLSKGYSLTFVRDDESCCTIDCTDPVSFERNAVYDMGTYSDFDWKAGGSEIVTDLSDGVRVAWDGSSERKIAESGNYARLAALSNGTYMAVYEAGSDVVVSRSSNLESWSSAMKVVPGFRTTVNGKTCNVNVANPEIAVISEDLILVAANYRPVEQEIMPYSIVLTSSRDGGVTWEEPQVLYEAGCRFADGCWEPSFLQLDDGTLHLYFADEGPYTSSDEQQISVLISKDKGQTWSDTPVKVCYRKGYRDGMPVPAVFGNKIVVAIEDNVSGQFKPYTVETSVNDPWKSPIGGNTVFRSSAFSSYIDPGIYMGSPYLVRLPSGEALMSYQTTEGRSDNWELSCMEVAIGDEKAKNFGKVTRPFSVPEGRSGKWNSLFVYDSNTVVAVTSSDKDGKNVAPWIKKGYLIEVGTLTADSYNDDLFHVCGLGKSKLRAGMGYDSDVLKVRISVDDNDVVSKDAVGFYVDFSNDKKDLNYRSFYIKVSEEGKKVATYRGDGGAWVQTALSGIEVKYVKTPSGYDVNIDFSTASIRNIGDFVRASFELSEFSSEGSGYIESMVHSDHTQPYTWHKMKIF